MKTILALGTASVLLFAVMVSPSMQAVAHENSIDICCAWNGKLADGELTYKIKGGDSTAQQTVRNAIEEWEVVPGLTLTEVSGKEKADIEVQFKKGGGMIAGQALRKFDQSGFITSVRIQISGSAFGNPNNQDIIAQITKHETGHALGLGHANFNGDLMSTTVQSGNGEISTCDVQGVLEANHWALVDGAITPHHPHVDHVHC